MARPRTLLHLRGVPGAAGPSPSACRWERWAPAWEGAEDGVFLELTGTERLYGEGLEGAARVCRRLRTEWAGDGDAGADIGPGGGPAGDTTGGPGGNAPGGAAGNAAGIVSGGLAAGRLAARLASGLAWRAAGGAGRERAAAPALLAVPRGGDAAFLGPFALAVLGPSHPRAVVTLAARGVRRLADLQAVPPAFLASLLGSEGARLAAAARGEDTRPLQGPLPRERLLIGVRLSRPLTGRQPQTALLRALAGRALAACPAGPACCESWTLVVRWGGDTGATAVSAAAEGGAALAGWRRQLETLWRRLPERRRGVTGVGLLAGPPARRARQGELFEPAALARLAEVWVRLRRDSADALGLGAERWLERWGAVWEEGVAGAWPAPGGGGRR